MPGRAALKRSGNFGINAAGRRMITNPADTCNVCCQCSPTISVVVSGIQICPCIDPMREVSGDPPPSGAFVLNRDLGSPPHGLCSWVSQIFPMRFILYNANGCQGPVIFEETLDMKIWIFVGPHFPDFPFTDRVIAFISPFSTPLSGLGLFDGHVEFLGYGRTYNIPNRHQNCIDPQDGAVNYRGGTISVTLP